MRIDRIKFIMIITSKDLTLSKLAEMSNLSRQTLSCIKQGKRCNQKTANKIAKALGIDVREIMEVE